MNFIVTLVTGFTLLLVHGLAQAQLIIGQTVGVTGAVAATVKESMLGANLYIDAINAKGGETASQRPSNNARAQYTNPIDATFQDMCPAPSSRSRSLFHPANAVVETRTTNTDTKRDRGKSLEIITCSLS